MNILVITLQQFEDFEEKGIYTDLMREFIRNNHNVYAISPNENISKTKLIVKNNSKILSLKIGKLQKTNIVRKGFTTLTIDRKFQSGIKKYFSEVKFDLILYATPPISFISTIRYIKERDGAVSYLLLKDIFPQNAIDLKMINENSLTAQYFRLKEKELYKVSDYIGCMSPANVDFILNHNPNLNGDTIEVSPNSIEPIIINNNNLELVKIRRKYEIPLDKTVYIYGGNLGKPQGIDFLIECLESNKKNEDVYFVIAGSGTEFSKLETYFEKHRPVNAQLFNQLPKSDYEILANTCDVGLIFLDHRFTIPNFPSRLLSYMQASMPILAATDQNTDIGLIIEQGGFGYWSESNDVHAFNRNLNRINDTVVREEMGKKARKYLEDNYTVKHSYDIIMSHFE